MAFGTPVAGTVVYSGVSNLIAATVPSGVVAGDALILVIGHKPSSANVNTGTASAPPGYTKRLEIIAAGGYGTTTGADVGNCNLFIFTKDVVDGTESGTVVNSTLTGTSASYGLVIRVPGGGTALLYNVATGSQSTTPSSSMSVNLTPTLPFKSGDFALWAMAIPTDLDTPALFSAHTITATGATFNTPVEFTEPDTTTNNDLGGVIAYSTVASGTATAAPVVGATLTGTLTNVRGPVGLLRITESNAAGLVNYTDPLDTSSASGTVLVDGSLNYTDPLDTSSANGSVLVLGSASASTIADTSTADGTVGVSGTTGTAAAIQAAAYSNATGTNLVSGSVAYVGQRNTSSVSSTLLVSGSVAYTGQRNTSSVSSTLLVSGSVAYTGQRNTSTTVGTLLVSGSSAVSQLADTSTASGAVGSPTSGSASITQLSNSSTATGTLLVAGSVAYVGQRSTTTSSGTLLVSGSSTNSQLANTSTAAGTVRVNGTVVYTIPRDTSSAPGTLLVSGSLSKLQAISTSTALGTSMVLGSAAKLQSTDTSNAAASLLVAGTVAYIDVVNTGYVNAFTNVIGSVEYVERRDTSSASGIGLTSAIDFSKQQFAMLSQAYYYHTNLESRYYV